MRGLEKSRPFYFAAYSTTIMKIIFRRYSSMKRLKNLFSLISALSCVVAPTLLMAIGIWMIYNVGLLIGLIVGIVGYAASAFEYCYLLTWWKSNNSRKTT